MFVIFLKMDTPIEGGFGRIWAPRGPKGPHGAPTVSCEKNDHLSSRSVEDGAPPHPQFNVGGHVLKRCGGDKKNDHFCHRLPAAHLVSTLT